MKKKGIKTVFLDSGLKMVVATTASNAVSHAAAAEGRCERIDWFQK